MHALSPAPLGSKVFCHIVRRRTALAAVHAYELYLEQPEQPPRLLLCARKARRTRGALYKISVDRNDFSSPNAVVARVRYHPPPLPCAETVTQPPANLLHTLHGGCAGPT